MCSIGTGRKNVLSEIGVLFTFSQSTNHLYECIILVLKAVRVTTGKMNINILSEGMREIFILVR